MVWLVYGDYLWLSKAFLLASTGDLSIDRRMRYVIGICRYQLAHEANDVIFKDILLLLISLYRF